MTPKTKTVPDLLINAEDHKKALSDPNHFLTWNVTDEFKGKQVAEIKSIVKSRSFPYAVCFENVIGDFNMATGIRNANAFNAREVFYIGNKNWDKRGAVGTTNYTDVTWLATLDEFLNLSKNYILIGIDNVACATSITEFKFKENMLFIFGEEKVGLTPTIRSLCHELVYIPQFGSVRSINVGTASGIVCNEFVTRFNARQVQGG
jgi:tRNA G18 (ribose-2'-O)-methylase SpoU